MPRKLGRDWRGIRARTSFSRTLAWSVALEDERCWPIEPSGIGPLPDRGKVEFRGRHRAGQTT